MNDQNGNPVQFGDAVIVKGHVVDVVDDPNFLNCTVQLDSPLPPTGTQMRIDLNTQQVVKQGPGQPPVVMPLPMLPSRLEEIRSVRHAAIQRVVRDLARAKSILQMLAEQQQQLEQQQQS